MKDDQPLIRARGEGGSEGGGEVGLREEGSRLDKMKRKVQDLIR